jgi:hypothetical protein
MAWGWEGKEEASSSRKKFGVVFGVKTRLGGSATRKKSNLY